MPIGTTTGVYSYVSDRVSSCGNSHYSNNTHAETSIGSTHEGELS